MDPLDQRLTDAGHAWRGTQPEPPDLDRMIAAVRRRPATRFTGRLMFAFVAGLLLLATVAFAPGVGSFLQRFNNTIPVAVVTPSPSPSTPIAPPTPAIAVPAPPSPRPTPTAPLSDREAAANLVKAYEAALVAGQ